MLTIRPTKMLARRLGIEVPPVPPVVTNWLADWCAHEFRVSRQRCLIFCNTASLYPVVMRATIFLAKCGLEDRVDDPVEFSGWLARTPMSALGMNSPDRVFPALGG